MASFYEELKADAIALVTEFGQPATIIIQDVGATYDTATGALISGTDTNIAVNAVVDDKKLSNRDGTKIKKDTKTVLVTGTDDIKPGYRILLSAEGTESEIKEASPIDPAGTILLWELEVSI